MPGASVPTLNDGGLRAKQRGLSGLPAVQTEPFLASFAWASLWMDGDHLNVPPRMDAERKLLRLRRKVLRHVVPVQMLLGFLKPEMYSNDVQ